MFRRLLIVFMLLIIVGCNGIDEPAEDIIVGEVTVTFDGARFLDDTLFQEAPEGKQWLAVDLTLENTGSQSQTITASLMFTLENQDGITYEHDQFAPDAQALDGSLSSGSTVSGPLTYAIEKNDTAWTMTFVLVPGTPESDSFSFTLDDVE